LEVFDGGRLRKGGNGLHVRGKGSDAGRGDLMAEERKGGLGKGGFCLVD